MPGVKAECVGQNEPEGEMVPVVEESGLVVGRAARAYCHGGSRLLHPVVHLHIIDRDARLFLQKRSDSKDMLPGLWDTAVGGHVDYGEYLAEALLREACEELRLTRFNPIYIGTYPYRSETESELVNIYATVGSYELHPDPDEISEGRWWTFDEIGKAVGQGILTPNFEMEFLRIRNKLLSLL
ncbi:MAG: NUDIX domain-containing protein [Candidatus Cryptobacteroides sp.]